MTEFDGPSDLDEHEKKAVKRLLYRLADDELVMGERLTEWEVVSPTLESDLALANIAQDELGHARLWYDLLADFDEDERTLIYDRDPSDFRHSSLVEKRFNIQDGDWADVIVREYLYDVAEEIRLEAIEDTSYHPLKDRVGKVIDEEDYHREHAQNWLERLCGDDEGKERVQDALDELFPYALTLFEPTDDELVELGLQDKTNEEMREYWLDIVVPFLGSLGLEVSVEPDDDIDDFLPEKTGRDGEHTDAWFDLHDEMTHTYEELDRPEPRKIMKDPK